MSLNTAHAPGGVLIFNGEFILLYCDGVDLTFEGPDAREFKGTKRGRIYLTTHRMVFTNKDAKDTLQSFSFPFHTISNLELEQPIFGANYIKGKVKAEPNGNWTGQCVFKLKFMKGGAIEFGQAMMEAAKSASRFATWQAPPPYTAPAGPFHCAPPPAYMPPPNVNYGFTVPTNVFPDAPPANTVFMTDMPPPYPGINSPPGYSGGQYPPPGQQYPPPGQQYLPPGQQYPPPGQQYPPPGQQYPPPGQQYPAPGQQYPPAGQQFPPPGPFGTYQESNADAKAAEAAQSAYAPSAPGYGYAPPPPGYGAAGEGRPQGPPPPYSEHSKKNE